MDVTKTDFNRKLRSKIKEEQMKMINLFGVKKI